MIASLVLVLSLTASPLEQCVSASDQAQAARSDGRWRDASRLLLQCAQESCPKAVRNTCLKWRNEVEEATPSLLVVVQADGADAPDAEVDLDGAKLDLDGTAVLVDPGPHTLVARRGARQVTVKILALEREKARKVLLPLEPEPKPVAVTPAPEPIVVPIEKPKPETASERRFPVGPLVLGVAGLGSLAAFIGLGLDGKAKVNALAAMPCAETMTCPDNHYAGVKPQLIAADVMLGFGIVLVVGAVAWLLLGM